MLRQLSLTSLASLSLLLACDDGDDRDPGNTGVTGIDVPDPVDPPQVDPGQYLMGIEAEFEAAASEFDVPIDVLKAVGFVESQWQMVEGEVEFDGLEPAFGAMALRGANLSRAAALLGVEEDAVRTARAINIRGFAAVLRELADQKGIDRDDLGAWARPIAELAGIEPESAAAINYVHQNVYSLISNGLVVTDLAGNVISEIQPKTGVIPDYPTDVPVLATQPDYAGATFRPSPNKSGRPASSAGEVRMVIIHTCEGAYSGCWGWLANAKSGVSAHYVVKEDGAEITQLVKEAEKAWHIAAKYDKSLNGGMFPEVQGASNNNHTVGIEHAGYGSQKSWNSNLIAQSAALVCDITRRQGIPRDKYHIVGHGQLQPNNRTDPGPNWPWATYFELINKACNDKAPPDADEPPPPPPPEDPPNATNPTGEEPPPDEPPPEDPPPDDPPPDDPPDDMADQSVFIVDSDNGVNDLNTDFSPSASWTATAATPGYYGANYYFADTLADQDDGAWFYFYLNAPGRYGVDVWYTAGANRADNAAIVAFDGDGNELGFATVDMQSGGKQWTRTEAYQFTAGWNAVMVSRWATQGYVVIADAVRLTRE